ncbi:MAG: PPC domain-containing protein [Phototrophicales bacterium]|nr:PPC domain-containing protein [Phototrophicales bacterium]
MYPKSNKLVICFSIIVFIGLFGLTAVFAQQRLEVGDVVEGTFSGLDIEYAIMLIAGREAIITLTSDDFDTTLTLLDANAQEVAFNDDSSSGTNSLLRYTPSADGLFTIRVGAFSLSQRGDFILSVIAIRQVPIDIGETERATRITELDNDYVVELEANQAVTITALSTDFDTTIEIFDVNNVSLGFNDDGAPVGGRGLDSFLGFLSPETGTYIIRVGAFSPDNEGAFTLEISPVEVTPVRIGTPTRVEFSAQSVLRVFSFDAKEGDVVTVDAEGGDFVTHQLRLNAPDGSVIVSNDQYTVNQQSSNAQLRRVILPVTGVYTVTLLSERQINTRILPINFSIIPDSLLMLDEEPISFLLGANTADFDVVRFVATEGETYRLVMTTNNIQRGVQIDMRIENSTGNNALRGLYQFENLAEMVIEFVAPDDGLVRLVISNAGFPIGSRDTSEITLSLEAK